MAQERKDKDVEQDQDAEKIEVAQLEPRSKPLNIEDVAIIDPRGITLTDDEKLLNRRVNLKMDIFVLPFLCILYLFQAIDKTNIGNAGTTSLIKDAHMSENAINNAVSLLYATLVPCQPLSTAFGKKIGMAVWIPTMMLTWGVLTIGNGFIKGDSSFYAIRLLIGAAEAGFYPSCIFYLSTCYTRFELALRCSIFFSITALAGAFSGLLAYGLLHLESPRLHSWQYLFIIEGSITVGLAMISFPYLAKNRWFLNSEEKRWAEARMLRDTGDADQAQAGLTWVDIREAILDWKPWLIAVCNILVGIQAHALSTFLPIILQSLGYAGVRANLFTVPVYLVGAVFMWFTAWSSDHFHERTLHILGCITPSIIGLILVSVLSSAGGKYAALVIMNMGSYAATPLIVSSLLNNTPRPGSRALVIAINGWGNLAGIISAQIYLPKYKPKYSVPFYASLGCSIAGFIGYFLYRQILVWKNQSRAKKIASMTPEEIEAENTNAVRLGDKKWTFVYTL